MKIPLMKTAFLEEDLVRKELAKFVLETPRFSMDQKCSQFEEEFAAFTGRKHAILVNSGSSANLAMLQILLNSGALKLGDEVAFSSLTWATNVMPIIQLGLKPIPVDVDLHTLNVMSTTLTNTLTSSPNIKCFFATNVLGLCGDLNVIADICKERNIILIEDNCESLGSVQANIPTGNFGLMSSHSFFVAHHMSTIEGGMILTDSDEVALSAKRVRSNGWNRNLSQAELEFLSSSPTEGQLGEFYNKYQFFELAYNLRPTEITGFLGLAQLKLLDKNIARRWENFKQFVGACEANPNIIHLDYSHIDRVSSFGFPLIFKDSSRLRGALKLLSSHEIECRPMISGNIVNQPFMRSFRYDVDLSNADKIHESGLYFGNYPELTDDDLKYIFDVIRYV